MQYVPHAGPGDRPCIIVDGAPHPAARLTLSHWPKSGTPPVLQDDLSTQIAFRYLHHSELHVVVEAVSNNHFDEDGLASLYTILHPEAALARRALLCDFAAAGDSGTYRRRQAARAAFIVSAYADPELSLTLDVVSAAEWSAG